MLVVFPIAFFTGTLLFDELAYCRHSSDLFFVGRCLTIAGIAGASLAAIPGILDAVYTVPPKSSARSRVIKHGMLNSSVLIVFIIALVVRNNINHVILLVMELAAVSTMWFSGWLGGTLVHRNHIGVYNRYADSGHWKEEYFKGDISYPLEVAKANDLKTDQMKLLHVGKERIVLARTADKFVAFEDRCTHKGGSLAGGTMICGTVQCPWHGTQFDVCSGAVKAGPAKSPIHTYRVSEEKGSVFLHR